MINSLFPSFGSIFTAFVASSCCIGPLAFTLICVGGIGFGASFEKYRPLLIVFTSIQIGVSYYLVNRPLKKYALTENAILSRLLKKGKSTGLYLG